MKIYILMGLTDYEGGTFEGSFSTREKAEIARDSGEGYIYDDYEIIETEVN